MMCCWTFERTSFALVFFQETFAGHGTTTFVIESVEERKKIFPPFFLHTDIIQLWVSEKQKCLILFCFFDGMLVVFLCFSQSC